MQVIDKKFMVRIENMQDSDPIETEILTRRVEEAKEHLLSFKWFRGIDSLWFAGGFSQVAVFFAEIDSIRYDKELWVVVGDLPPAHLVTDDIPDVEEALLCYVDHMREWVSHVKQGKSVEDCIPVNVEPTIEHAEMLETRLNFIESEYLPSLGDGARVVS